MKIVEIMLSRNESPAIVKNRMLKLLESKTCIQGVATLLVRGLMMTVTLSPDMKSQL